MANLKINILAQDKTKGALRSVKGGLASIKNAVFSLKGAFVTLGTGVALRAIGNVASNFEDLRDSFRSNPKKPLMGRFYENQRKSLNILVRLLFIVHLGEYILT